jgi:hypothetical protein
LVSTLFRRQNFPISLKKLIRRNQRREMFNDHRRRRRNDTTSSRTRLQAGCLLHVCVSIGVAEAARRRIESVIATAAVLGRRGDGATAPVRGHTGLIEIGIFCRGAGRKCRVSI